MRQEIRAAEHFLGLLRFQLSQADLWVSSPSTTGTWKRNRRTLTACLQLLLQCLMGVHTHTCSFLQTAQAQPSENVTQHKSLLIHPVTACIFAVCLCLCFGFVFCLFVSKIWIRRAIITPTNPHLLGISPQPPGRAGGAGV